jgi:hypothetical protein
MLNRESWHKSTFSPAANACVEAKLVDTETNWLGEDWRISSASGNGNSCVEAKFDGAVHIRNSIHPDRGTTAVDADAWREFVAAVKEAEFEI